MSQPIQVQDSVLSSIQQSIYCKTYTYLGWPISQSGGQRNIPFGFFFFFFLKTSSECSNLLYPSMWNQARLSGEGRFWPCWHEGGGKSAPCGSGSMNEITRRPWTCLGIENRYDRKSQIPVGWNHGPSLV